MHFTDDNENDTSETMESLIDKGKLDQVVYDDQLYHLKEKVDEDKKGKVIGAIGQTFFVDGDGKRWSEEELKEPYISNNPDEIREKNHYAMGRFIVQTKILMPKMKSLLSLIVSIIERF